MDLSKLQAPLITLAQKTSAAILKFYQSSQDYVIQEKSDHSPCTQADIVAHQILRKGLHHLTPDIPILSEEGRIPAWQKRREWSRYWLLDPLDGTRQFIRHSDEFTVNIALIENHRPIFGLIYVPVTDECYYAYDKVGARKIDAKGHMTALKVRPWVEQTQILASHGAKEARLQEKFGHLGEYEVTRMGSSWKFCLIAEGKADIAPRLGDTSEWDTAAGQCILEAAGGALLDWSGNPLRYNTKPSLLNPHFVALGDYRALRDKLIFVVT